MPSNRSTTSAWRSPPLGWPNRCRARYIRLCLDCAGDASPAWRRLPALLACVRALLGDHVVEVACPSVKPAAWAGSIPWRQSSHSWCRAHLPLSRLTKEEEWLEILECSNDGYAPISAYRGGGATRHLVWGVNTGKSSHSTESIELHLAVRHIAERDAAHATKVVHEFFRLGNCVRVRAGYGEFLRLRSPDSFSFGDPDGGSDRWLSNALLSTDLDDTNDDVLVPRWCTLLTPSHLERLGGFKALRDRATESLRPFFGEYRAMHGRPLPEDLLTLIDLGNCALFQFAPLDFMFTDGGGQSPRPSLPLGAAWFLDELARAGLLASARHGRMDAALAALKRQKAESRRPRAKARPDPTIPASEFAAARIEASPPRCVRTSCSHDPSPPGVPKRFRMPAFRITPPDGQRAMPVYGRAEESALAAPILVGSLDAKRAALFFDSRIHGHDGEWNDPAPEHARPLPRLKQLTCPRCAGRLFDVWAAFEYPDDLHLPPERVGGARDYFSWFTLIARCAGCGHARIVADIECA